MTQNTASKNEQPLAGWRFRLGLTVLIVGWLSPLLIPVITRTALAIEWKTIISGLLAVGIPEVFTLAAIAIMGKQGYDLIKDRIFRFLKKHGPPDRVSLTRYRIGLVMFLLPVVFGWLGPYGAHRIPHYEAHRFVVSLIGDVIFFASVFVLGGDFWDKLRALFIHQARVQAADKKLN
ncbi:MAG: transporter suffix domain-containing protein [Desulfobacterales bacterium]|nr:MAG: transporter suffix domain-containing protein [Desulfobacterales bacterium]